MGVPVQLEFWEFLLSSSKKQWGLMVYEQDWLDYTEEFMPAVFVSAVRGLVNRGVPYLFIWKPGVSGAVF